MTDSKTVFTAAVAVFALLANIPLGRIRAEQRRLSAAWFLCVHLSIPYIYALRKLADLNLWAVSIFVLAAVIGQLAGGRLARGRKRQGATRPMNR